MNKGLETLKNISKDKNKEKLIYILLAGVVILISSTYIFKEDENKVKSTDNITYEAQYIYNASDLEDRLSNILSKIDGIQSASCFITYKDDGQIIPFETEEGAVIYNEKSASKEVLIERKLNPSIEGIIIVASFSDSKEELKMQLATAVASVMNIEIYKVQIFDKEV